MGGRGSSSGGGGGGIPPASFVGGGGGAYGGFPNLQGLIGAMQASQAQGGTTANGGLYSFHQGEGNSTLDWTDNGNPTLIKWQEQSDETKAAKYLSKLGKGQTPAADAEGYAYHQSPYQNMVIDMDLNKPVYATMDKKNFDAYCKANNLTPIYRGWASGQSSKDRFENAAAFHTGTGMYGEGLYFGDKSTASGYGSTMSVCALSPNARVVDIGTVRKALGATGSNLQKAFGHSGKTNSYFSNNSGEAQMAVKMGANVIRTDWCYVILSRDAVVVRK